MVLQLLSWLFWATSISFFNSFNLTNRFRLWTRTRTASSAANRKPLLHLQRLLLKWLCISINVLLLVYVLVLVLVLVLLLSLQVLRHLFAYEASGLNLSSLIVFVCRSVIGSRSLLVSLQQLLALLLCLRNLLAMWLVNNQLVHGNLARWLTNLMLLATRLLLSR